MRYSLSFRWLKFAMVAVLGSVVTMLVLGLVLRMVGVPQESPMVFLAVFAPFAIWYLRRAARDRREFEAGQGPDARP